MTRDEFVAAVAKKFNLDDGWYEREGYVLTTNGGGYQMAYDKSKDGENSNPRLEPYGKGDEPDYGQSIDGMEDIECHEPEKFFHAKAIMTANGEEYIHIAEPGKWFNHVFINFHDEGCFSMDTLDDDLERIADLETTGERIQECPFFQNPVAKNLQEFFDMLIEVPEDTFWDS